MATVAVYCSSSSAIDPRYVQLAAAVGTELGRRGHDLVSGGGSVASMGAVARAARAAGARTVGVIPRALVAAEVADHDAHELVVTDDMRQRKGEMDRRCDGFLALAGGLGTLEELLEIWVSSTLGMHTKPVVVLDDDGLYAPLRAQVELLSQRGFVRPVARETVVWATSVTQAFDALEVAWAQAARPARPLRPIEAELLEAEP